MADNTLVLGEAKTLAQIIMGEFDETNGVFEDSTVQQLNRNLAYMSGLRILKLPNVTSGNGSINNNTNLKKVYLPKKTNIYHNFMTSNRKVVFADFGMTSGMNQASLQDCLSLSHLILRNNAVVGGSMASNGPFVGSACALHYNRSEEVHVYVPRALISQYKTSTGWQDLVANRPNTFRAIEDYSVDGTVTGDIDETRLNPARTIVYSLDDQVFDGSSVYFDTNLQLFNGSNKFTICIDYTPNAPANYATLLHCADSNEQGFLLRKPTNTQNYFKFLPPGTTLSSNTISQYYPTRNKVRIVCDGTRLSIVVFTGENAYNNQWYVVATGTPTAITDTLLVGAAKDSSNNIYRYWKGTVHKLRVYQDVLSPWECNDILELD